MSKIVKARMWDAVKEDGRLGYRGCPGIAAHVTAIVRCLCSSTFRRLGMADDRWINSRNRPALRCQCMVGDPTRRGTTCIDRSCTQPTIHSFGSTSGKRQSSQVFLRLIILELSWSWSSHSSTIWLGILTMPKLSKHSPPLSHSSIEQKPSSSMESDSKLLVSPPKKPKTSNKSNKDSSEVSWLPHHSW